MTAPQSDEDWSLAALSPVPSRPIPPAKPYVPTEPGELVTDAQTGQVAVYMATEGGKVYLRGPRGGVERAVDPKWISPGPTDLEVNLRERNNGSRLGARLHRDAS
ncbi:hypothetical protein [Kitasatospora purpeofusca]|uniref:hypothetical protein n=1 Tax=Kitasatospora purpeofusca TaxID=67352 RepID=UPI0038305167